MPFAECILLVGHTGVRYDDIAHVRSLARELFSARLVLVTDRVRAEDARHFDHVHVTGFAPAPDRAELDGLCADIRRHHRPLGVLPFLDKVVPLAACLAEALGLPGADPLTARAGTDKAFYRSLERGAASPEYHHPVTCAEIRSLDELIGLHRATGGKLFLKPNSEGNSRGCISLEHCSEAEVRAAWDAVAGYRAAGIVAEELITGAREYSWDYAAGAAWLTEKTTSSGRYRAEIQQIVPAASDACALLHGVGEFARELVCRANGAYHTELFHIQPTNRVAVVEVNMRPGGMHIWDLARNSFADFDPWRAWVEWCVSGRARTRSLRRRAYTGIRYLRAPEAGLLQRLPDMAAAARAAGVEIMGGAYTKSPGDVVSDELKDNAAAYGYLVCEAGSHAELRQKLHLAAREVERSTLVIRAGSSRPSTVGYQPVHHPSADAVSTGVR